LALFFLLVGACAAEDFFVARLIPSTAGEPLATFSTAIRALRNEYANTAPAAVELVTYVFAIGYAVAMILIAIPLGALTLMLSTKLPGIPNPVKRTVQLGRWGTYAVVLLYIAPLLMPPIYLLARPAIPSLTDLSGYLGHLTVAVLLGVAVACMSLLAITVARSTVPDIAASDRGLRRLVLLVLAARLIPSTLIADAVARVAVTSSRSPVAGIMGSFGALMFLGFPVIAAFAALAAARAPQRDIDHLRSMGATVREVFRVCLRHLLAPQFLLLSVFGFWICWNSPAIPNAFGVAPPHPTRLLVESFLGAKQTDSHTTALYYLSSVILATVLGILWHRQTQEPLRPEPAASD
jgi:hypothetical protein